MKKTKYILIILIGSHISRGRAQNDSLICDELKVMQWYFNSSFGYYLPLERPKALDDRGGFAGFNFEGVFKDRGLFNLAFDQGNVNFETTVQSNGLDLNYKSRLKNHLHLRQFWLWFKQQKIATIYICRIRNGNSGYSCFKNR